MLHFNRERFLHLPETYGKPTFINCTKCGRSLRASLCLVHIMISFQHMKAGFTTAAGALYQEARPTAIRQSQVGGTR